MEVNLIKDIPNELCKAVGELHSKGNMPEVLLTSLGREKIKFVIGLETSVRLTTLQVIEVHQYLMDNGYSVKNHWIRKD